MMTLEDLKKHTVKDILSVISQFGIDDNDSDIIIICKKYSEYVRYHQLEIFNSWALKIINEHNLEGKLLRNIRKQKINKLYKSS